MSDIIGNRELLSIDFEFKNSMRSYLVDYMDEYDDCYYQELSSKIFLVEYDTKNDKEYRKDIGYIEVWLILGNRAINNSLDIVDLCDSIEQELYEYADSMYKDGGLNEKLDIFGCSSDVLVLHRIEIKKEYRGKKYGLFITNKIIEYFGFSCGAIVVRPCPLQFSNISRKPGWEDEYDTSLFQKDKVKATRKLQRYWSKLGFCSTKKHGIYYLSMAYKLNKINLGSSNKCNAVSLP